MTTEGFNPSAIPWPVWMLRYVGSDDREAMDDLVWSVGGSPPYGGVSYEEAAAVYEVLDDYRGPDAASETSYAAVRGFLDPASEAARALEVFRCCDAIQSNPDGYGLEPVTRGLELSRKLGHAGAEASFLAFEAGWHLRRGDEESARRLTLQALDAVLQLADDDEAYALRAAQNAANAVSLTARTGDIPAARKLLDDLGEVIDPELAEQLRQALDR